ncbi:hypothetical protein [Sphingobacterium faecale]|uniref:Lasso RiPP family leader peptide-containing protein n=1 Tax=Sphingobacterium faecale TaxID=2803775 RepID=A0ABS1R039_9SPHI|nr:hypothetical protein [Sphingobacterium faecale]MBL1407261.1 hypothetical protein [Sphingobacterium faecale]
MDRKKKKYLPPLLIVTKIELEHSIAASSTTIGPGGGGTNSQPWITEEEVETIEKDWIF